MRTRLYLAGFLVQLAVVISASILAYAGVLPTSFGFFPGLDKVGHFTMIGLLAFFLDGALERRVLGPGRLRLPLAALLVLAVAGVEEVLQRYSPHRGSSLYDFLADAGGVITLTWLSRRLGPAVASVPSGAASSAV